MDPLVFRIIQDYDSEYNKFKKGQQNAFQEHLARKGVTVFEQLDMRDQSIVVGNKNLGQVEGEAIIRYQNGTIYVGNMIDGQRSGFGYRSYNESELFYVGEYSKDKKEGKGKIWDAKKQMWVFDGMWSNDLKNGFGVLKKSFATYEGNFVDDKMDGKGKMSWANGDVYEGEFKQDMKHGMGRIRYKLGDFYEGQFFEGKMDGTGTYIWENGMKYRGTFKQGILSGEGRIEYPKVVSGSYTGLPE